MDEVKMLNEVLKKIDANRISMPFKNEIMSFDFFNLISEKIIQF